MMQSLASLYISELLACAQRLTSRRHFCTRTRTQGSELMFSVGGGSTTLAGMVAATATVVAAAAAAAAVVVIASSGTCSWQ